MKPPVDIELLKKFVKNTCTDDELSEVKKFLNDPGYQDALGKLLDEHWELFTTAQEPTAAERKDWAVELKTQRDNIIPRQSSGRVKGLRWFGYAAACLLLPVLLFLYKSERRIPTENAHGYSAYKKTSTSIGQRAEILLSDGTVVTLGPGSQLSYPEHFGKISREIFLVGEAFFEVAHNHKWPFIVHSKGINTRVLGTSFKVDAQLDHPLVVSLVTGKVRLSRLISGREEVLATLLPGNQGSYSPEQGIMKVSDFKMKEMTDWKAGLLSFNNITLAETIGYLEKWYNVRITFGSASLGKKKVRMAVDGRKPITSALKAIGQMTGLNYHIKGKEINIY